MEIKHLGNTSIEQITSCLREAFRGYYVQISSDPYVMQKRFRIAKVDYELSYGVFDEGRLVAFIINGIDVDKGMLTAFNTGTGVIQEYRGRGLVDKLYQYALPNLLDHGVKRCSLEVIDQNARAIAVYERIGFRIIRSIHCYKGEVSSDKDYKHHIQELPITDALLSTSEDLYSWDNKLSRVSSSNSGYKAYEVTDSKTSQPLGTFIINPISGRIAQMESLEGSYEDLLDAIASISEKPTLSIINIDPKRSDLMAAMINSGMQNYISQYEMEMYIA